MASNTKFPFRRAQETDPPKWKKSSKNPRINTSFWWLRGVRFFQFGIGHQFWFQASEIPGRCTLPVPRHWRSTASRAHSSSNVPSLGSPSVPSLARWRGADSEGQSRLGMRPRRELGSWESLKVEPSSHKCSVQKIWAYVGNILHKGFKVP